MDVTISDNEILYNMNRELIRITPCGNNAIRFQAFANHKIIDENYNLMPMDIDCDIEEFENYVTMTQGSLKLKLEQNGKVTYFINNKQILTEQAEMTFNSCIRNYKSKGNNEFEYRVTFDANDNEHFFGLGHHIGNLYDQKGCTYDIVNKNAYCFIPFVYSSLGYGFLWNCPSTGRVELTNNRTRWVSDSCKFVDYVVIAGTPKEVSGKLADLTGHAPEFPEWAGGFWQSKLRYETQDDLLTVARRYKDEGIPLSVIICDYFHWTEQGEYKFDPKYWHDIKAMTDELHKMGTRLYVSVWPTINENSENYQYMLDNNMLIKTKSDSNRIFNFYGPQAEIDATNAKTRAFVWNKIKENYIDNGVDGIWLDESEPEINPVRFDNLIFDSGNGETVALLSPYYYSKMIYDGMKSIGRDDIITLTRCGYFGSQKTAALLWSGDIISTFESLKATVHAGLNMAMCGIPWWNSDIGGFYGADTTSDYFRELIVRWFQFGVFSPVMRLHGNRNRHGKSSGLKEASGDPNELWSFGEENFKTLKELVFLRERLREYIKKHMDIASEKGYPIMRPMFFEYPDDEICYQTGEQYMFGDDIIFAPIVEQGQKVKRFYIPNGEWTLTMNAKKYTKGWHDVEVSLTDYVVLVKKDADIISAFMED